MDNELIYCTYLTIYKGNKMPPFYIGSSSIDKVNNGYHGSVKSKLYQSTWENELRYNPHLFKTYIISRHATREDALKKELLFQKSLNVIHSPLYINRSLARKNGCFGVSMKRESHPNYGKRGDEVSWYRSKRSDKSKENYSKSKRGIKNPQACTFIVYDNLDRVILKTVGGFIKACEDYGLPKDVTNKLKLSYKNNGEPLTPKKKGKTGPRPKFDSMYVGWYAVKISSKPWHKENEVRCRGRKWWHNPITGESKLCHHAPEGFIAGRGEQWLLS